MRCGYPWIVGNKNAAVFRYDQVEFDDPASEVGCLAEGGNGIFGIKRPGPSMGLYFKRHDVAGERPRPRGRSGRTLSFRRPRRLCRRRFLTFLFLDFVAGYFGPVGLRQSMCSEEGCCGSVFTGSIELVLSILLLEVGVRAWWVWRGIEIIEVWFVNNLVIYIQDHVRMSVLVQVDRSFCSENRERYSTLDLSGNGAYNLKL